MSKILYNREIEDELMIQFIILFTLSKADEPLSYTDLLNVVQGNCEINFTDFQLGLDNLIQTGHVEAKHLSDILTVYTLTQKGIYVSDFFYGHIPLIIREPIIQALKQLYIDKRRKEAVKASVTPINENEYTVECDLFNDDKIPIMSLSLYAGSRKQAEIMADYYKKNSAEIYGAVIDAFIKAGNGGSDK